jgi:hypothetical protein
MAMKWDIKVSVHVINCAPLTPIFLPKKPETIDPNKGKVIIAKYIIYILLQYFLLICKKQPEYLNLFKFFYYSIYFFEKKILP